MFFFAVIAAFVLHKSCTHTQECEKIELTEDSSDGGWTSFSRISTLNVSAGDVASSSPPRCVEFLLSAPDGQLVQAVVTNLSLGLNTPRPHILAHTHSELARCLSVYVEVKPSGQRKVTPDNIVCDSMSIDHRVWFSSSQQLQFVLPAVHADTVFIAKYRFLDRKIFSTTGERLLGPACQYLMFSDEWKEGYIFSEGFPGNTPRQDCTYTLYGTQGEIVSITVRHALLPKRRGSCTWNSGVLIHDGVSASSQAIGQLCGHEDHAQFTSSGQFMHVVSHLAVTSETPPPGRPLGFALHYQFHADPVKHSVPEQFIATKFHGNSLHEDYLGLSHDQPSNVTSVHNNTARSNENSCNRMIVSGYSTSGRIESPRFPDSYPPNILCRYEFKGRGNERVRVEFIEFSLSTRNSSTGTCKEADTLTSYVIIDGRTTILRRQCGSGIPPTIMSSETSLLLQLVAGHRQSTADVGFSATYTFVEDFGIAVGQQMTATPCGFEFFSSSAMNGTFSSPNHPGLYPRNTDCHYVFHGSRGQQLRTRFSYFDVEGIAPCWEDSASDYIQFSSTSHGELTSPKYCGQKTPPGSVTSRDNYFRVLFHANGRFDGTGFRAEYEFLPAEGQPASISSRRLDSSFMPMMTLCLAILLHTALGEWHTQ